jgi:hypothetical protein
MTATIAAFGLVPLLFATGPGSEIQKPLAIVVIGGLISSTLLTLVLLPILYERFGNRGPNGRREIALSIPDPGPWKKERPMRSMRCWRFPRFWRPCRRWRRTGPARYRGRAGRA